MPEEPYCSETKTGTTGIVWVCIRPEHEDIHHWFVTNNSVLGELREKTLEDRMKNTP